MILARWYSSTQKVKKKYLLKLQRKQLSSEDHWVKQKEFWSIGPIQESLLQQPLFGKDILERSLWSSQKSWKQLNMSFKKLDKKLWQSLDPQTNLKKRKKLKENIIKSFNDENLCHYYH